MNKEQEILEASERHKLSKVIGDTFIILKQDYSLLVCGESLTAWLSLGGLIRGDMRIMKNKGLTYYEATISSGVFFRFILDQTHIFEVTDVPYGYKVKIKKI